MIEWLACSVRGVHSSKAPWVHAHETSVAQLRAAHVAQDQWLIWLALAILTTRNDKQALRCQWLAIPRFGFEWVPKLPFGMRRPQMEEKLAQFAKRIAATNKHLFGMLEALVSARGGLKCLRGLSQENQIAYMLDFISFSIKGVDLLPGSVFNVVFSGVN